MGFPIAGFPPWSRASSRSIQPDFPFTLGAQLKGFWRHTASDIVPIPAQDDEIEQVNDRSSGGWHATQTNAALRLLYDETEFSVGGAVGGGGQSMDVPAGFAATMDEGDWTIWCVGLTDDEMESQCFFSAGQTVGNNGYELTVDATNTAKFGVRVPPAGAIENGAADTSRHLLIAWRVGGLLHYAVDNTEVALSAPTAAVVAPSGSSRLWGITAALWGLVGVGAEVGAASPALSGGPGVGNPLEGQLNDLWLYCSGRYLL